MKTGVRIVHNRLLGGWYIVRGPHQTPISGVFPSKAAAQAHLMRKNPMHRTLVRKKKARVQRTLHHARIAIARKLRTKKAKFARERTQDLAAATTLASAALGGHVNPFPIHVQAGDEVVACFKRAPVAKNYAHALAKSNPTQTIRVFTADAGRSSGRRKK